MLHKSKNNSMFAEAKALKTIEQQKKNRMRASSTVARITVWQTGGQRIEARPWKEQKYV